MKYEKGNFPSLFREVLSFAVMSGMGGGVWMDDKLNTDGMTEAEIAESIENRKNCIPWSIVKECCAIGH